MCYARSPIELYKYYDYIVDTELTNSINYGNSKRLITNKVLREETDPSVTHCKTMMEKE